MKKSVIATVILLVLAVTVYCIFSDSLPPRTPYKIARQISSLEVSNSFKVDEFADNLQGGSGVVPSGDLYIKFDLTDKQLSKIEKETTELNYKKLPIEGFMYTPKFASKTTNGCYKLEKSKSDPLDFKLVVLDTETKKLHIYLSD